MSGLEGEMRIRINGTPAPQGSKKLVRGRLIEDNPKVKPWRDTITRHVAYDLNVMHPDWQPLDGPIEVRIVFYMPRPKSHYRTGKYAAELRPDAPHRVTTKPDVDKLCRAVLDALTDAHVWHDDSQVALLGATKHYAHRVAPGADITIRTINEKEFHLV